MREFQLITDTNSDLPKAYIEEMGIKLVPQYTLLDGVTYEGAEGIDPNEFYEKMAAGSTPQSQAINPAVCEERFREVLDEGKDILYLSFSSALSSSYSTAVMIAGQLKEEYPDAKIEIVDTLAASIGEGLIVMNAADMWKAGKSMDEVISWTESTKLNCASLFTVDTLKYLERGGRVSKTAAVMGTVINIKPLMHVDNEGRLAATGKERGRKKSISALLDDMEKKMTQEWKAVNTRIGITHGNCLGDVERIENMVTERFGIKEFVVNDINPSIGVHSGPGTICISFYGCER